LRRIAAIFFILVVVFNLYGYQLVITYLQINQSTSIEQKLDRKEYTDSELISIKTALHLPYYSSSPNFERAYGSITVNGIDYEYVKKRVYQDTLELLCIPNYNKSNLQTAANELTKIAAGGQASLPAGKTTLVKISLPDYCNQLLVISTAFLSADDKEYSLDVPGLVTTGYAKRQEIPPQSMHA
jgi:hypothetical protein